MPKRQPVIATTRGELSDAYHDIGDRPRSVVMTLGGLHTGHAQLMSIARDAVGRAGHVTATIFVNPLQFGATEDLAKYPRTLDDDIAICADRSVDLVFTPTPGVMYPLGDPDITVDPGELGRHFEGADRQAHFAGVLTVVAKLLMLTGPQFAVFGEKDYQQLTLVRRLVRDLDFDVDIIGAPIVRADDGLALSTRNQYLPAQARQAALAIPQSIAAGRNAAARGATAQEVEAATFGVLDGCPGVDPVYAIVTDPRMGPAPRSGEARLIVAAIVGGTRLLDNARIDMIGRDS